MKIDFTFKGTPGTPGFAVAPKEPNDPSALAQVEHVETFVSSATRLNGLLALAEETFLDRGPSIGGQVQLGVGVNEIKATLGKIDNLTPFPSLHQVIETEYACTDPDGPPNQDDTVHFKGSTAGGETWWRRTINGPCDKGEIISLNRQNGTISLEEMPWDYDFPWANRF